MNYMEQVAKMLGVELEEEFKLNDSDDYKYKITKDGMFMYSGFARDWYSAYHILLGVLIGKYEIVKKPILDDAERQYLSNVIKPFRHKVVDIFKYISLYDVYEYIGITIRDIDKNVVYMYFPSFKKGTMYKGMETGKKYSLEELGLLVWKIK